MSFVSPKATVEEGDTVLLFLSMTAMYPVEVVPKIRNRQGHLVENKLNTMYGMLKVMDLVGAKYGGHVDLSQGWAYVLHPTCELWTKTLPHRTQIIYTPDISLIIMGLDLKPGATVIEAGTGSGSLSHALIRTVQPTGHLFTFDFHEKRVELAREEFMKHGLSEWVTAGHRDAISDGFSVVEKRVDAVFLDLPSPWLVIPHVQNALKRGGRLCTFSPCIEQVQKTCETLKQSQNFILIKTHEVLQKLYSIQSKTMSSLVFTPQDVPEQAQQPQPQPEQSSSDVPGTEGERKRFKLAPIKKDQSRFRTLVLPPQIPGHTGYLTFATFVPTCDAKSASGFVASSASAQEVQIAREPTTSS